MADDRLLDRAPMSRMPSPTTRDVAAVLFRRRKLLSLAFVFTFAAVLFYGLLTPRYQAQMKVLLRRGRVDPPMTPQATAASETTRAEVTEQELNSEVELLTDADLLRKVVRTTRLYVAEKSSWTSWGQTEEACVERAARRLAARLTVEPIRKATVITVKYDSSDPVIAAQVLNALAGAYLEKHLLVHRPSGEFKFFNQQTEQYRTGLRSAEATLRDLIDKRGVVSAALQRDIALQKLSDADASHRQLLLNLAETEERIAALRARLPSLPPRTIAQVRSSDNPQLLEQLKSTLLRLQLKRTELLTKFEPSYRLVQEVDQQLAETKAAIAAENLTPVREEVTEKNPHYERAQAEVEKAEVELSALRARAQASSGLVRAYYARARQLGDDWITQQDLLRTAKAAEDNYLLYIRKREEARIGDALDERGILNVTILEPPAAPTLPKQSLLLFATLGVVFAAPLSIGIAFASDYLDPSFHTPDDVVTNLNTPVLASFAREPRKKDG